MATYVGLLYSIILPAGQRLSMAPMREMMEAMGFAGVQTLLATGNVIFDTPETRIADIEARVEAAFADRFGKHIDFIVRDAAGWKRLVAANPFPEQSASDGAQVGIRIMREPLTATGRAVLERALTENELLHVVDGDPWTWFSGSISGTRLASALQSRHMGVGTSRNWNTVKRIDEALDARLAAQTGRVI